MHGQNLQHNRREFLKSAGTLAVGVGEAPELAAAAVWGLVGSAQSEHPGRFVLADVDGAESSWRALPAALFADEHRDGRFDVGGLPNLGVYDFH